MKTHTIDELILAARPPQFEILRILVKIFSSSPHFACAYVRGSIANKNFDRASDVDFVAVFDDAHLAEIRQIAENIMRAHFNVIFPPWLDTIVPNFGGTGYVYLIEWGQEIFSIDLYFLPASMASSLEQRAAAKLIYARPDGQASEISPPACSGELATPPRPTPAADLHSCFVEVITLSFLLMKRLGRQQRFLNYGETYLTNRALCRLVRTIFDPAHLDYGWYQLDDQASHQPIPRPIWTRLTSLIQHHPVSTLQDIAEKIAFSANLLKEEDPDYYQMIEPGLIFFQTYYHL